MNFFEKLGKLLKTGGRLIIDLFTDQVQENGNVRKISLHRLILIVLVTVALTMWTGHVEIPATMMTFLLTIAGVVFGDKALTVIKSFGKNPNAPEIVVKPEEHGD